jgi:hypothetical protein
MERNIIKDLNVGGSADVRCVASPRVDDDFLYTRAKAAAEAFWILFYLILYSFWRIMY